MAYKLFDYQQRMVAQAHNTLADGNKSVLIVSPPGSGKSVVIAEIARLVAEKDGFVLFLVHRKELVQQITQTFAKDGIPADKFLAMTVGKVVNRFDKIPRPTLIITDEAHHSRAATYMKIYEHYQGVPKLGFTATPWRMNGDGFDDIYSTMVLGPSVKDLIQHDHLAPYHYFGAVNIDTSKLKRSSTGDYSNKSMDDAFGKFVFGDTIKQYRDHANGQQAIVYAYSVDFSKQVAQAFNHAGISAAHADATTPATERDRIMTGFKNGDIKVLCNVDLVSEGYDVPDCGVVILLRPTKSLVMYLQQSMRGMRYQPGKTSTIIDQVGNFKEHGLPDDDHEWTLKSRPKKPFEKDDPIYTCEFCLSTFRHWVTDDYIIIDSPNDKRQKYCPNHDCHMPKPVDEKGDGNGKEFIDADLVDLTTEEGRLIALAAQRPKASSPVQAYKIIEAQIETGKRKAKSAVYSLAMLAKYQNVHFNDEQLAAIADVSGWRFDSVRHACQWANEKYKPTPLVFNF